MKKNIRYSGLVLILLTLLISCSPKVTGKITGKLNSLPYDAEVVVFDVAEEVTVKTKQIGTISLGDSGFTTKCGYDVMIEKAKLEARKNGANIVKITEHKSPDLWSTCHRLKAVLYFSGENLSDLKEDDFKEPIIENADYALLHVYRYSGVGTLVSYNLKLGDSVLCRVKNNYKSTIKITKEGLNTLRAKTESGKELPIDIEFGKHYYLRCSVSTGIMVGRPKLELVDYRTGKSEFDSFEAKRDETKK